MAHPAVRGGASHRGFSLAELVIVLALVALLAGFLTPVISASKERAREGTCISQLHQIGSAFRMYMDDYGGRPQRLYELWPQYVTDERILVCPDDRWVRQGGWAWSALAWANTPPEHWPIPVSYGYFFDANPLNRDWEWAHEVPGNPGYVVCVLHGTAVDSERPGQAPLFGGRTLRLCFSGAVIALDVRYPRGETFNSWKLMTGQDKAPNQP